MGRHTMGSLGVQEMLVIFLVALVLFGPKKLPELGRTIGKALTEFRRASNDLKATFEREMQTLERETESIKQMTHSEANAIYDQALSLDQQRQLPAPETAWSPLDYTQDHSQQASADVSTATQPDTVGA